MLIKLMAFSCLWLCCPKMSFELMNEYRKAIDELAGLNKREKEEQGTCSWGFWDDMESREKERLVARLRSKLLEIGVDPDETEEGNVKRRLVE